MFLSSPLSLSILYPACQIDTVNQSPAFGLLNVERNVWTWTSIGYKQHWMRNLSIVSYRQPDPRKPVTAHTWGQQWSVIQAWAVWRPLCVRVNNLLYKGIDLGHCGTLYIHQISQLWPILSLGTITSLWKALNSQCFFWFCFSLWEVLFSEFSRC